MNRTIKSIAVVAGIFFLGMITGLALPQFNIWPYSACHGLGGAIEITHYEGSGLHGSNCVIPWTEKATRPQ